MRAYCRYLSLMSLTLAASAHAQAPTTPIRLEVRPAFSGMAVMGHAYPIVVTVQNTGSGADGVLSIEPASFMQADLGGAERRYLYHVPLPTGTVKRILAYPTVPPDKSEIDITLSGNFKGRRVGMTIQVENQPSTQVGLVGDQAGALGALRAVRLNEPPSSTNGYEQPGFRLCDARPEDAPDRMVGYASLDTLVVADGAERLLPAQWAAIRRWVMTGGTLLLSGGPGAVYLNVPDVRPLLPVQSVTGAVAPAIHLPGVPALPGPVGLMTGALKPGAMALATEGDRVVVARQGFGAGTVLFTAFSVVEPPFRGWSSQAAGWTQLLGNRPAHRGGQLWSLAMRDRPDGMIGAPPGASVPPGAAERVDPFRIQLPPTRTIVLMFLAYFILVVPVTYLVLRKAKRLEWAWATGPLLSIAFAFGFGLFASELYKAGLSRRTGGLVVAAAGEQEAMFIGSTEMFFPRGGDYTLEVPGAESLETAMIGENYYGPPQNRTEKLETVDNGTVAAPEYGVTNLAFRRVFHAEPAAWDGVTGTLHLDASGVLSGRITNGTKYTLIRPVLIVLGTGFCARVDDIRPGQTVTVRDKVRVESTPPPASPPPGPHAPKGPGGPPPMPGPPPGARGGPRPRPARITMPGLAGAVASEVSQRSNVAAVLLRNTPSDGGGPRGAVLFAETAGAPFGPTLGHPVGDDKGVDVLVSLPLVQGGS